ncbi:hypothetical protein BGZ96_009792 [Linnemannia gamsii]|uniref:Spindle pole body component n=1 Tax=Linnemannia gamsii TaxID=64522 RepID=A0ABQ7JWQ4_9FUNG|nr:hypothetical protein BGZ96_009792 [Linnemannia gamsii]
MQDLDPASLLFIPRDEYTPLQLDPELFESVGDGVSLQTFNIPKVTLPTTANKSPSVAAPDLLGRLKSLAAKLDPPNANGSDILRGGGGGGGGGHKGNRARMDTTQSWDVAWEQDLDQRVLEIGQPNIFDSFHTPGASVLFDFQEPSTSPVSSEQGARGPEVDLFAEWNPRTAIDSPSHPAGPTSSPTITKETLNLSFDLPVLSKRPRNILDDCVLRDQNPIATTTNKHHQQPTTQDFRAGKVAKTHSLQSRVNTKEDLAETWRAAGKPIQDDLTGSTAHGNRGARIQEQLRWETCSKSGLRTVSSHLAMSPYMTEAGTTTFESVYLRLLESMISAGTHMRRLVAVADTCINHPEGMGLIRIAFGRSLSSYLTFLQGTVVSLQESCRDKQIHLLELHHKTHDLGEILSRLAHLCQCHVSQESSHQAGFYLPPGPNLLSMIYSEILVQPSPSDDLWVALLLSMLDQASKPYRDIISRWVGITPLAHGGHDRNQLSTLSAARRLSLDPGHLDFTGHNAVNNNNSGNIMGKRGGLFSIFDSHLQQSLQGLDPFGEFFVSSRHGWSWDGSELIVLADPLEYNGEFKMSETVFPARFLGDRLAERVMEAGKELQILVEFEPRHPLIAHDRNYPMTSNWLKWFYIQSDLVKHRMECAKARAEVLDAVGTRLRSMRWISKKTTQNIRAGKQKATDSIHESRTTQERGLPMDLDLYSFDPRPGQGANMRSDAISLELGLDPDLLGFFTFSSTLGQTKDLTLACPDMMSFLLEPTSSTATNGSSPPSGTAGRKQTRLKGLAPLSVLAEQSLCYTIRARTSLINTCVMSLYFHDLNLLGHLEIMERFLLMRDGHFVARLGEALFEDETGLLIRCAEAANEAAASEATDAPTKPGAGIGLDRRGSVASTSSNTSTWRKARLTWPPRSGEVEMTLRAVLHDCFQVDGCDELGSSQADEESEMSDMEVEDDEAFRSFVRDSQRDRLMTNRRKISTEELEETLAFAVKGYEDESTICRDANALEALDFLYLDYKAPRPLRLLIFTPSAFEKYTRLFTFQLRLARVGAAMKQVYRHLRTRQKLITAILPSLEPNASSPNAVQVRTQLQVEMRMLHRFRFEAQQIFDGLQGYIVNVAMGQTWEAFMDRLRKVQCRLEEWIISGSSSSFVHYAGCQEGMEEEESGFDELGDLVSLRNEHDQVLDRMLLQSLLKRKQAPILKIVHGILNCLLRFSQMVTHKFSQSDLADLASSVSGEDNVEEEAGMLDDILERQRVRMEKLQSLQDKFRGLCRMLVKVLKVLDERGVSMESSGGATSASANKRRQQEGGGISADTSSGGGGSGSGSSGFLQLLLLRLDMSGFNNN